MDYTSVDRNLLQIDLTKGIGISPVQAYFVKVEDMGKRLIGIILENH